MQRELPLEAGGAALGVVPCEQQPQVGEKQQTASLRSVYAAKERLGGVPAMLYCAQHLPSERLDLVVRAEASVVQHARQPQPRSPLRAVGSPRVAQPFGGLGRELEHARRRLDRNADEAAAPWRNP